MKVNSLIIILFFFSYSLVAQSQVEIDTHPSDSTIIAERYTDYSDQLLLKVMSVVKSNSQQIINTNNNQSINLKPSGTASLGFGFNYKWLGLAVAFGLPISAEEEKRIGKTTRFDFQLNIYSKKFIIDAFAQQYNGFYVDKPNDLTAWSSPNFPLRDSMETTSVGVGGYYIFNNKKLSYKAAYVRNAVQTKSAGSFLLGGFYNLDYAGFEPGATSYFVPDYFPQAVQDSFPFISYRSSAIGVSFGYTYTFVFWKHFFINLTAMPGVGGQTLIVYTDDGKKTTEKTSVSRFVGRMALGYENKHFILGLTSYGTTGTTKYQNFEFKPSTNNIRFFLAKRFNVKKKK